MPTDNHFIYVDLRINDTKTKQTSCLTVMDTVSNIYVKVVDNSISDFKPVLFKPDTFWSTAIFLFRSKRLNK